MANRFKRYEFAWAELFYSNLVKPVAEMNITGNFLQLWKDLVAVGSDPDLSQSWRVPSLVFDNVDFSGI